LESSHRCAFPALKCAVCAGGVAEENGMGNGPQNERFGQDIYQLGQRIRVFEAQIEEYRAAAEKAARKDENERKFEKFHRENGPANTTMSRDRRPTFPGGDRPNITRFDGAGKSKFNNDLNDEQDTDMAGRCGGGGGNSNRNGMLFPSFVGCFASCEIL
jgi:hypothetical protein